MGFYLSDYVDLLPSGRNVDVVFKLGDNIWNDKRKIQLIIADIIYNPIFKEGLTIEEDSLYLEDIVTIPEILEEYGLKEEELLPDKNEYINVFKDLEKMIKEPDNSIIITNLNYLAPVISSRIGMEINPFKLSRILEVLDESNNITLKRMLFDKVLITKPLEDKPKIRLTLTSKYKKNHNI